jgi:SAM-dependent methyltransferase
MINKNLIKLIALKIKLRLNQKKAVVFGLYVGELQFLKNIIQKSYTELKNPIIIAHENEKTFEEFSATFPEIVNNFEHVKLSDIKRNIFTDKELGLYISSEAIGIANIYSVYPFHGQPSKGLTFVGGKLDNFDALFLYGQLQKEAFEHFVKTQLKNKKPTHLSLYEIGYTKSDDVINGKWKKSEVLKELGLPQNKITVLYAPAFNKNASLREFGLEIIKVLCSNASFNVIAKLPIDCLQPQENEYANGGVNWFFELSQLEKQFENFRLFKNNQIDPVLEASDVLITCVSSVSFEFMALQKPVVFINTPLFYSKYLKKHVPEIDMTGWEKFSFVNGGKEFGVTVDKPEELPSAIYSSLKTTDQLKQTDKLKNYLLYNPGKATEATIKQIQKILSENRKTLRPRISTFFSYKHLRCYFIKKSKSIVLKTFKKTVQKYGYSLTKNVQHYIKAEEITRQSRIKGLSVCDYVESLNIDKRKIGKRDRVIHKMESLNLFLGAKNICEIGTGTGMYLEKTIEKAPVQKYEVYETDQDWNKYLVLEYKTKIEHLIIHNADGISLYQTKSDTIDLVHAHAVFVYLPIINNYVYLKECVRVCKKDGYIVFDVISDDMFSEEAAKNWLNLNHKFAVITPDSFIFDFIKKNNLALINSFNEIYAGSQSKYFILQKC